MAEVKWTARRVSDGVLVDVTGDTEGVPAVAPTPNALEGGGGAPEEGTVVEQLTGTQTEYAHVYRGDEDPAVDFGAELEVGDLWIDTNSQGYPFARKVRNEANDGWDFDAMVVTDGAGLVIGFLKLNPDGSLLGNFGTTALSIGADGAVELVGGDFGTFLLNVDGITLVGASGLGALNIDPTGQVLIQGTALQFGGEPVGTQAGAVDDVVDPATATAEDVANALNALLASLRASDELAT